jgi:hypothetical protein
VARKVVKKVPSHNQNNFGPRTLLNHWSKKMISLFKLPAC